MGLNDGRMKTLAIVLGCVCFTQLFSSCGECPCNSHNSDYLRDVPVTRSARFR